MWPAFYVVELDVETCDAAGEIAERTGVRTLDALHLAAATRAGTDAIPIVTFDVRLGAAARTLRLTVLGA